MLYYSGLSRTLRQLRWVLYPRRCPFCDRVLGNQPACPDCADGLAELRRAPSMRLRGSEHYLGRLDGAAAPYRYTGLVRRAVLRAKYQGAPWAAVELGVEMARLLFGSEIRMRGSEPLPEPVPGLDRGYDCILPVPASSKKRGYNVPERMAQPLARAVGVPVVTDALTRARSTRRQEGLSLDERLANVAGAFRVARYRRLWRESASFWWTMF
ncbi:MAG: ComF family protein [Faecalibacterium sp.]